MAIAKARAHAVPAHSCGAAPSRRAGGFSLILAMLTLALIALTSSAIMRNAVSADQAVTNGRFLMQANQFAQVALRFCEGQLTLAPSARSVPTFDVGVPPAWTAQANWTSAGARPAHTLVASDITSSVMPPVAPRCMIEATVLAHVFVVTARGFSPDFSAEPASGATRSGAVVWLQSTVLTTEAETLVAQRVWQQLLTPPF
jgi:type IV pilus assembly protein PilX